MEKTFQYKPDTVITLELQTNQKVAIQSAKNLAPTIDLQFPVTQGWAQLMGRWIVECRNQLVHLRENQSSAVDDYLVLASQQPEVTVKLTYTRNDGKRRSELIPKVNMVSVYPREVGGIKVVTGANASGEPQPNSNPNPNQETQALQAALSQEKARSERLQKLVDERAEAFLNKLREEAHDLGAKAEQAALESSRLMQQIHAAEDKKHRSDQEYQVNVSRLKALQDQTEAVNANNEALELNCDAAKAELEELKAHINLDDETLRFLASGHRLKHGTISKSLKEMQKELEKIESKIAMILQLRIRFNQVVDDAILNGQGTILASDEPGGDANGNRSSTAAENP